MAAVPGVDYDEVSGNIDENSIASTESCENLTVEELIDLVEDDVDVSERRVTTEDIERSLNGNYKAEDNFLLKLLRKTELGKPNIRLALTYLIHMVDKTDWKDFISATLRVAPWGDGRGNGLIHEAAMYGYIDQLVDFIDDSIVNLTNSEGETPLHCAVEGGHAEVVKILIDNGAEMKPDNEGRTPLHLAAMSSNPDPEIIELLVETPKKKMIRTQHYKMLQKKTKGDGNTALHIAAGNVDMTEDALDEMYAMDVMVPNKEKETPFHIAAKSRNSELIVWMLDVFGPGNDGGDIDDADDINVGSKTLLNICVEKANSKAIACLIRHGADIKKGVLRTIVTQSAIKSEEANTFVAVYHEVVENAVLYDCLEKKEPMMLKSSSKYVERLNKVMLHLIEEGPTVGSNDASMASELNVIEYAIECGASELLLAIVNTEHVYRQFFNASDDIYNPPMKCSAETLFTPDFYCYDVTGFIHPSNTCTDVKNGDTMQDANKMPYLTRLIKCEDQWRDTDILKRQPFKQLTVPLISFIQRLYFLAGSIQLAHMILFTIYMLPTTCSMSQQFNLSLNACETTDADEHVGEYTALSFIVWPFILAIFIVFDYVSLVVRELKTHTPDSVNFTTLFLKMCCWGDHNIDMEEEKQKQKHEKKQSRRRTKYDSLPIMLLMITVDKLPTFGFCICSFFWYAVYVNQGCYQTYLEIISLAFLFGWLVVFVFFSGISKELYIFSIVLRVTIVKDIIKSFMLVFMATVVGFAFAMYVLRLTTLPEGDESYINGTIYEVFLAGLAMGDFSDTTKDTDYYAHSGRLGFYKTMFAFYVSFTAIVLVNLLIAMMSNTYEAAKTNAENVWRFRTVAAALRLHDSSLFRSFVNMVNCFYFCLCCCCCCCCCGCESIYDGNDLDGRKWKKRGRFYIDVSTGDFT